VNARRHGSYPAKEAGLAPERPGRKRRPACPICGKPQSHDYRPFCSKHCADIDLGRWLDGRYAVPGEPVAKDERSEDEER
jgi:endogenous inhibitor of DNA gyrase (YacG/DUF329 family)